jgi:FkbM family methyltransferase
MVAPTAAVPPFGTYPPTRLQALARDIGGRLPRKSWPARRLSGWMRSLLRRTARRPIDVTVLGQRMRLHLGDNACERRLMVTPQFFDPVELEILRSVVGSDFHFVDLGANVGTYSVFVGTLAGPDARILAVEPQASLLKRLLANIALNNLDIRVAPVAVGDHEGTVEFATHSSNLGFTSLNTQRRGRGERRVIELPMRTLLALVKEHGFERIDALKADIEGAEDLAILPFMEQAPRSLWPRLIFLENSPHEWRRNCVTFLEELGYVGYPASAGNVVLQLPPEKQAVKPAVDHAPMRTALSRTISSGLMREEKAIASTPAARASRNASE